MNSILKTIALPDIDLSRVLSIEHRRRGIQLAEDDHIATLYYQGQPVARWNANQVQVITILAEADKYLSRDAVQSAIDCGGISFGRI